jgi:hypothetical protein
MTTGFSGGREALRNVDVAIGAVGRPGECNRRGHVIDTSDIGVFLGLDVGKGEHHATAVTSTGKKAFDKRLPNSEPKLREVFAKLLAKHGTVLVMSHTLRSIELTDETVAELEMIVGVDDDLAGEVTRIANRPPWAADPDPPAPGASCRPAHPASGRADAAV